MDDKTVHQLIELPPASETEHDEVIYWHTVVEGGARGVRLFKTRELIEYDLWVAVEAWQSHYGGRREPLRSERDQELAALKAYQSLDRKPAKCKCEPAPKRKCKCIIKRTTDEII